MWATSTPVRSRRPGSAADPTDWGLGVGQGRTWNARRDGGPAAVPLDGRPRRPDPVTTPRQRRGAHEAGRGPPMSPGQGPPCSRRTVNFQSAEARPFIQPAPGVAVIRPPGSPLSTVWPGPQQVWMRGVARSPLAHCARCRAHPGPQAAVASVRLRPPSIAGTAPGGWSARGRADHHAIGSKGEPV